MIARLGREINDPSSICYWAWRNDIPIFCPALTDGSLGDMLFFHTYKNPGLVLDIVQVGLGWGLGGRAGGWERLVLACAGNVGGSEQGVAHKLHVAGMRLF